MALFFLVIIMMGLSVNAQLSTSFYSSSCPKAEDIVRSTVESYFNKDPTIAAGLLRLHFHDCFVQVSSSLRNTIVNLLCQTKMNTFPLIYVLLSRVAMVQFS